MRDNGGVGCHRGLCCSQMIGLGELSYLFYTESSLIPCERYCRKSGIILFMILIAVCFVACGRNPEKDLYYLSLDSL